jgi:hypothetical protein
MTYSTYVRHPLCLDQCRDRSYTDTLYIEECYQVHACSRARRFWSSLLLPLLPAEPKSVLFSLTIDDAASGLQYLFNDPTHSTANSLSVITTAHKRCIVGMFFAINSRTEHHPWSIAIMATTSLGRWSRATQTSQCRTSHNGCLSSKYVLKPLQCLAKRWVSLTDVVGTGAWYFRYSYTKLEAWRIDMANRQILQPESFADNGQCQFHKILNGIETLTSMEWFIFFASLTCWATRLMTCFITGSNSPARSSLDLLSACKLRISWWSDLLS